MIWVYNLAEIEFSLLMMLKRTLVNSISTRAFVEQKEHNSTLSRFLLLLSSVTTEHMCFTICDVDTEGTMIPCFCLKRLIAVVCDCACASSECHSTYCLKNPRICVVFSVLAEGQEAVSSLERRVLRCERCRNLRQAARAMMIIVVASQC